MGAFDDLIPRAGGAGAPTGGAFDDLIPSRRPEQPNSFQAAMNGPLKGVTNMLGFLPGVAEAVTSGPAPTPTQTLFGGGPVTEAVDSVLDAPRTVAHAIGKFFSPDALQKPLRTMGLMPEDPNYQAPTAAGRMMDTANEYLYGGAVPAIMSPALAGPMLLANTGAAVEAAPARELFPDNPIAEMVAALAGGTGLPMMANTAARTGSMVKRAAEPFTESGRQKRAGEIMRNAVESSGGTVENAVGALDQAASVNTGGYKATTGTLSNNEGLIALERGQATDPRYVARTRENDAAISGNVNATLDSSKGAQPAATGKFLEGQQAGMLDQADQSVANAEGRLASGKADLAAEQGALDAQQQVGARASAEARDKILAAKAEDDKAIRAAYGAVDPNLPADFTNTHAAAVKAKAEVGDTGVVPSIVDRIISERAPVPDKTVKTGLLDQDGAPITRQEAPKPKTFFELEADLKNVNQAIREAETAGRSNDARILGIVKDGINADLDKLGANNDALRAANQQYRESYAPKFKQGASADVLRAGKGGAESAVPPSETIDRYMRSPEEAARLKSIIGDNPEGAKNVRDWFVSDLAKTAPKGDMTADRVKVWMERNGALLDQFPAVKAEVQQMRNRLQNKSKMVGQMEQDVKTAAESRKETQAAYKDDPASLFIGGDPIEAVGTAMSGKNAEQKMRQLLAAAGKDGSGQAREGLVNATKEWLNRELRRAGAVVKGDNAAATEIGDLKVSFAKANDLMTDPQTRRALEAVLGKEDVAALDRVRKQLEISDRRNARGTTNSETADLMTNLAKGGDVGAAVSAWAGPIKGTAVNRLLGVAQKYLAGDPAGKAKQLILDAMLDPELARTLLLRPSEKNAVTLSQVLEKRMAAVPSNAAPSVGNSEQNDSSKPPKR